jgi:cyclophilin family peptidyl-prolyl cis-trans isomerase
MIKQFVFFFGTLLLALSCKEPKEQISINRFSDPKLERIYDLQDRQATKQLIPLLRSKKEIHREAAVLAFASIQDSFAVKFLSERLLTDSKVTVRKAAAYAIGQMRDSANVGILFTALENEISSDSRKYILEALGKSANADVLSYFNQFNTTVTQLREGHVRGMYRAMYQRQIGDSFAIQCLRYFDIASSDETQFYAAGTLARLPKSMTEYLKDTIEHIQSNIVDQEIRRLLLSIIDGKSVPSEKIAWNMISNNLNSYKDKPYDLVNDMRKAEVSSEDAVRELKDWTFNHRYQAVRTAAAELYFGSLKKEWNGKNEFSDEEFLERCIKSRDMALQSLACYEIIAHPNAKWKPLLEVYMDSLAVPRQMETYIDIGKALSAIADTTYKKPKPTYNHPIDWSHVKAIPSAQRIEIITSQGRIEVELKVDDAPGSVSNFLKMVDEDFYTNKFFHRVVPNFVIQAGCYRGDGWGSPDWTQRSEFSNYLTYSTGAVGLASSGNNTEGVQIFITHNPTPFLDGRYSIFGYVTDGMDVVNMIAVGDQIKEVNKITAVE